MNAPARTFLAALVAAATLWVGPSSWCGKDAARWADHDAAFDRALAEGVGEEVDRGIDAERFSTGSTRFDAEWVFGTYLMAAVGIGQVALEHGATDQDLRRMDACLDALVGPAGSAADTEAWGAAALDAIDGDGHAAWLGYAGLAFAMRERVAPGGPHSADLDRIVAGIRHRLATSGPGGPETYPGERYPVDQAAMVGTLGLWAQARGVPQPPEVAAWIAHARERFVDRRTGLLVQAVASTGEPVDEARGSGTFLAAWFLSFADPSFSAELYEAGRDRLSGSILRFGMMREYPWDRGGSGDIDSGPVVLGFGISSTGFAMGAAAAHGDRATFRSLYATADLFGAPRWTTGPGDEEALRFTTGGPLGDALMLAMLTTRRAP